MAVSGRPGPGIRTFDPERTPCGRVWREQRHGQRPGMLATDYLPGECRRRRGRALQAKPRGPSAGSDGDLCLCPAGAVGATL